MKIKQKFTTYLLLISILSAILLSNSITAFADSNDNGNVILDEYFLPGQLETRVTALDGIYSANDVISLTVEGDVNLSNTDIDYIQSMSSLTSLYIPNSPDAMNQIGDLNNFFTYHEEIISVYFPGKIFLYNAFNNCRNLESVNLPNALSFQDDSFTGCSSLTAVDLPAVDFFGPRTFNGCVSLTSISLPKLIYLGTDSFQFCTQLTSVSFPSLAIFSGSNYFDSIQNGITMTLGTTVPTADSTTFSSYNPAFKGATVVTPAGTYDAYDNADSIVDGKWWGWTIVSPFMITYDGNGNTTGNAPTDASLYDSGDTVTTLDSSDLEKTGSYFSGWNTSADGSGISYAVNDVFTISSDITLYAQWTDYCQVTYDGNTNTSGTPPIDTNFYRIGDTSTVLAQSDLEKTSMYFAGWNTADDGSGITYNANDTYTISADITLFAHWTDSCKVTYDGNENTSGTPPIDENLYHKDDNVTVLDSSDLTKTGYTFNGWNTESDGSGTTYADGATLTINTYTTLYAQWKTNSSSNNSTNTENEEDPSPVNNEEDPSPVNNEENPDPVVIINTQNETFYVSYFGNGHTAGNPPIDSNDYQTNESVMVKGPSDLEKTDYQFVAWNTESDGSGTTYIAEDSFQINSNINLYATWQEIVIVSNTEAPSNNAETSEGDGNNEDNNHVIESEDIHISFVDSNGNPLSNYSTKLQRIDSEDSSNETYELLILDEEQNEINKILLTMIQNDLNETTFNANQISIDYNEQMANIEISIQIDDENTPLIESVLILTDEDLATASKEEANEENKSQNWILYILIIAVFAVLTGVFLIKKPKI